MTLPRFLGIGAQKSGTTWLYARLKEHPTVFVPNERKEIHFFDRYFSNGVKWYASFFPESPQARGFQQWGEVTPKYLYDAQAPERIRDALGESIRLIVILRDPVERLFSQYRMAYSRGETQLSPEDYFAENEDAFDRGLYSNQIQRYLNAFERQNLLILFYEEVFSTEDSMLAALNQVGDFLGIDNQHWDSQTLGDHEGNISSAGRPKAYWLFRLARRFREWCMDHDMEGLVRLARRAGINNASFGGLSEVPRPSEVVKSRARQAYVNEVQALEGLLGRKIPFWKSSRDDGLEDV